MDIVLIIILAVAAIWFWSVNGAKKAKRKFLLAFVRTIEDQVKNTPRDPSWHRDKQMREMLKKALAPVPSKASPYDPEVVEEWLDASLTQDDIHTFMYHAETVGFSPAEQIALAPDAALAFLNQDLMKAAHIVDKMILLRLVTGSKKQDGQVVYAMNEFSYNVVKEFFLDFGGKDDRDDEYDFGPTIISCDFSFRGGSFHSFLRISDDPKSAPEVFVFDMEPSRKHAGRHFQ
ncbi:hypothetical protein [Brevundimonas naejangsanensis]|uniref:hypothetical protein n=1 Tax=Brevundimonas naejangsanensis TaxID=588932 RepID=UPI0034D6928A